LLSICRIIFQIPIICNARMKEVAIRNKRKQVIAIIAIIFDNNEIYPQLVLQCNKNKNNTK